MIIPTKVSSNLYKITKKIFSFKSFSSSLDLKGDGELLPWVVEHSGIPARMCAGFCNDCGGAAQKPGSAGVLGSDSCSGIVVEGVLNLFPMLQDICFMM